MPRYFTLDEANITLEIIRPLVREALEIRTKLLELQPELAPVLQNILGNGGNLAGSRAAIEFDRLHSLITQINATGAQLKDINSGLVDFLARREGRDIYLCWRYGEERVSHWHDLDTGFAGRQAI
ncbi:MAG: DUF2203 domain-containing protein [Anaerolineales bacterium]|nr:MAG: DUF2203 domain-containing protein [Anaerolineales bacterium]